MSDVLERARQLLAARRPVPAVAFGRGQDAGAVRFVLNCSVHVRPQLVVAEERGGLLHWLRSEPLPASSASAGSGAALQPLGSFRHDIPPGWLCLHCFVRENPAHNFVGFWKCSGCGALNCAGMDRAGWFRCACGNAINGGFTAAEFFEVRGVKQPPAAAPVPVHSSPSIPAPPHISARPSPAAPPGPPPLRLTGRR